MSYKAVIDINVIKLNVAAFIKAVVQQTDQAQNNGGGPFTWYNEWQTIAKPLKPYIGVKVTGPSRIGSYDEIRGEYLKDNEGNVVYDDEGNPVFGEYDLEGERLFTVSLTFGSDDETGPNLANTIMAALQAPQYCTILEAGGYYSVRDIHPLQDVTLPLADGTKYERKSVLDFYLGAVSSILYDAGIIQTVSGNLIITPPGGSPIEIPLTVPGD